MGFNGKILGGHNLDTISIHPINFESGMQPIGMVTNGYKGFLLS